MDVEVALLEVIAALLGANLVGISRHRGVARDELNAVCLLVVTRYDLARDRKYGLVQTLLRHSNATHPLEVLVIREGALTSAQPSVLAQLHYSEHDRPALTAAVGSTAWLTWPDGPTGSVDRSELVARLQDAARTLMGRPLLDLADPASPVPAEGAAEGEPPRTAAASSRQLPFV